MTITHVQTPYEFLVRWDDDGVLKGAHIVFIDHLTDGAQMNVKQVGNALPVALVGETGFPLADVIGALNVSALADGDTKAQRIAALEQAGVEAAAEHSAALASSTAATQAALGERDAAVAQVQKLQGQLDALKAPVDANGVPKSVPMEKAQRIMLRTPFGGATLLDAVQTAVEKMVASGTPEGREAGIIWEKSNAVERTNPLLKEMQAALGLTDEMIDQLFVAADALV